MPTICVTVTEDINVPEDTLIVRAPTGAITCLRLPDGTEIKPWIVYENVASEEDLTHDELMQMNVDTGLDYKITIESDLQEVAITL
ncbi:hypothetical protein [Sphingomonas sp. 3-13AW]|uniref:hypothetical protein n=1 Tax=Sphingomonas sp. 3-13AW TaxID=3050450 RepID=UPI003BB5FE20